MTAQQPPPVADTESGAPGSAAPAKKASRAGRNLPAAIAVGALLGAMAIAILLFAPKWWFPLVAGAIAIATHEVVAPAARTRLRDARSCRCWSAVRR